jgi:hypothetical protein
VLNRVNSGSGYCETGNFASYTRSNASDEERRKPKCSPMMSNVPCRFTLHAAKQLRAIHTSGSNSSLRAAGTLLQTLIRCPTRQTSKYVLLFEVRHSTPTLVSLSRKPVSSQYTLIPCLSSFSSPHAGCKPASNAPLSLPRCGHTCRHCSANYPWLEW